MEIKITPEKLGLLTEAEAKAQGATAAQLLTLDWVRLHGRKHYRKIDIDMLTR